MGDWWYLVYSEQASFMRKVQYFKGKTLEELKATTANDAGIWPDNREGMLDLSLIHISVVILARYLNTTKTTDTLTGVCSVMLM